MRETAVGDVGLEGGWPFHVSRRGGLNGEDELSLIPGLSPWL